MSRTPHDVTDAELAVLQTLWERGTATVRQLAEALYPEKTGAHHATVQKLLERLEAKDCVTRDRSGWPYVFQPAIDREDLIGRRLQTTADKLCAGSFEPLLTHLVRGKCLSAEQRQCLRGLLDELDRESETEKDSS